MSSQLLRFRDNFAAAFAQSALLAGGIAHGTGAVAALTATSTCIGAACGRGVSRVLAVMSPSHSATFRKCLAADPCRDWESCSSHPVTQLWDSMLSRLFSRYPDSFFQDENFTFLIFFETQARVFGAAEFAPGREWREPQGAARTPRSEA